MQYLEVRFTIIAVEILLMLRLFQNYAETRKLKRVPPGKVFEVEVTLGNRNVYSVKLTLHTQKVTPYFNVHTDNFTKEILDCCSKRLDNWANFVKSSIECYMSNLHAYDVVYHQRCSVNFQTGRNVPTYFRGKVDPSLLNPVNISGRPESSGRNNAFLKTCDYLEENSEKVFSLAELAVIMQEFITVGEEEEDASSYSNKHMKRKLSEHYGNEIVFSASSGRETIVTFRCSADYIIRRFFSEAKDADRSNKTRLIIEAAAKLIKVEGL